jgi:ubiquinone/menaquinone biosynthesis C-methylase UbiE
MMDNKFEEKYIEVEKNWWWFRGRRDLILQIIKEIPYNDVLEIGCGSGELSNHLKNYTGVDISSKTSRFIVGDAQKLPIKDNSVDLILLLDLLEHTDDKVVMEEVFRVLKPEGIVLITVPAFMFLWSQHDVDNHHKKRYRRGELPLCKFEILKFTYWNSILFPIMALAKKKKSQLTVLPKFINYTLKTVLKIENYLILKNIRLPIGVTMVYKLKSRYSSSKTIP